MKAFHILIMLTPFLATAQILKGRVVDKTTQQPVPYVNIGVLHKSSGTVSMEDGSFEMNLDGRDDRDTIKFSSIGYYEQIHTVSSYRARNLDDPITVMLEPSVTLLKEVVINGKSVSIGHPPKTRFTKAGLFFNRLGHEIGTLFENKTGAQRLDSVQLNFVNCDFDTVFIRLNVYSKNGNDFKNILPQNILLSWNRKKVLSRPVVNLAEYNLGIGDQFMVSIEIVKDLGALGLKFYAVLKADNNLTYFRSTSQDTWQMAKHKDHPIGISLIAFVH